VTPLRICRFIAIYLTAITLSLTLAHLLEMPAKMRYTGDLYMAVQHTLYFYFAWVGAIAEIGAIGFLIAVAILLRKRGKVFYLTLIATVCVATGLAVWFAFVSPANTQMAAWHELPLPSNWMSVRNQWEWGHAVSALLDLVGFGALIVSLLAETREGY